MQVTADRAAPEAVRIIYRNYRGETAARCIVPLRVWFGTTEWHPEPQWLLDAVDIEKQAERSFAFRDILEFDRRESAKDVPS